MTKPVNRISNEDGFDITEGVQIILDALHNSMDAGSGMLDYRDWCAIRQVAWALGVNPDDFMHGQAEFEIVSKKSFRIPASGKIPTGATPDPYFNGWYSLPACTIPWPAPHEPLTDEPNRNTDDD